MLLSECELGQRLLHRGLVVPLSACLHMCLGAYLRWLVLQRARFVVSFAVVSIVDSPVMSNTPSCFDVWLLGPAFS